MLVISRKRGQSVKIGEGITVRVLGVQGNTVRIGVDAPPEIRVLRSELPLLVSAATLDQPVEAAAKTSA